ncbi:probable acylpyruvase FAHD2, mitochondrial [Miscanthus floridulus]|uniref:probable acylpyruvase FAHD2, mitochondrial n=1 Tax=Miscanthus floridulus TaxID=154761 RepID=UPI00345856D0
MAARNRWILAILASFDKVKASNLTVRIAKASSCSFDDGYALALDMTARDLQSVAKVDDELRQKGPTIDMLFKIPFLISYISSIMTLMEGDVILTGTPEGVGPVRVGQKITAGITDLIDVEFDVQRRNRCDDNTGYKGIT